MINHERRRSGRSSSPRRVTWSSRTDMRDWVVYIWHCIVYDGPDHSGIWRNGGCSGDRIARFQNLNGRFWYRRRILFQEGRNWTAISSG
jgi:hypothetical protein